MVTSITYPRSLGAWGSCSILFLSSTPTPQDLPQKVPTWDRGSASPIAVQEESGTIPSFL